MKNEIEMWMILHIRNIVQHILTPRQSCVIFFIFEKIYGAKKKENRDIDDNNIVQ